MRPSLLAILAPAVILAASPALAQSCAERLDRFAAAATGGGAAPTTGDMAQERAAEGDASDLLAQSDGVIAPPATGDMPVIDPGTTGGSGATGDGMPTAPAIPPQTAEGGPQAGDNGAAQQAQMESLVAAARDAQRRGDEAECTARLDEAEALASGAQGGTAQ
ncbi:MAG TPA: hypothetical protein VEH84_04690 [Alphaproteobacteria bacterium]|nr:hypothetical protein [Alphaproteobacteria bacterium]